MCKALVSRRSEPGPAGCVSAAIQTLAKAVLAAINPFRAAKQVRDLKEYSSAWIMINSTVAKVPEALAGSVCVQAHMCLRQWESLSALSPENPLQGQSLSPGGLLSQLLLCAPVFLIVSALTENSLLLNFKPRAEITMRDKISLSLTSVMSKYGRPYSSL